MHSQIKRIKPDILHFDSDYMEGAHPMVMQRLVETNHEQTVGYGEDGYTTHAANLIREACGCPDALVRFLVGGTQANATVIDGLLHQYEGIMASDVAHINNLEAGAVESSGHKILIVPSHQGKVADRIITQFQAETRWISLFVCLVVFLFERGFAG